MDWTIPEMKPHWIIAGKKQLSSCLESYNAVQQAKQFMFEKINSDKEAVFKHLADTITSDCPKASTPDSRNSEYLCNGAIMALSFFPTIDDDKKIQQLVIHASKP